jgi:hypothetical protein
MMLSLLLLGAILSSTVVAAAPERPQFDPKGARVIRHKGRVVPGKKDLRRIVIKWDRVPDAEAYEVCHQCDIDDETGTLLSMTDNGKVHPARENECGGRPCLVMPGAPIGYHRFNFRVKVGSEWSVWSKHQNYLVAEPGNVEHQEL